MSATLTLNQGLQLLRRDSLTATRDEVREAAGPDKLLSREEALAAGLATDAEFTAAVQRVADLDAYAASKPVTQVLDNLRPQELELLSPRGMRTLAARFASHPLRDDGVALFVATLSYYREDGALNDDLLTALHQSVSPTLTLSALAARDASEQFQAYCGMLGGPCHHEPAYKPIPGSEAALAPVARAAIATGDHEFMRSLTYVRALRHGAVGLETLRALLPGVTDDADERFILDVLDWASLDDVLSLRDVWASIDYNVDGKEHDRLQAWVRELIDAGNLSPRVVRQLKEAFL